MNESDRFANYPGDQSHIIYDAAKGPDYVGRYWQAVDVAYDETADRSRVRFARVEVSA